MSKRIIKVQLTEQSIDNAIKELEDYKKWLKEKTQEFVKALADEGMQISRVYHTEILHHRRCISGLRSVQCAF